MGRGKKNKGKNNQQKSQTPSKKNKTEGKKKSPNPKKGHSKKSGKAPSTGDEQASLSIEQQSNEQAKASYSAEHNEEQRKENDETSPQAVSRKNKKKKKKKRKKQSETSKEGQANEPDKAPAAVTHHEEQASASSEQQSHARNQAPSTGNQREEQQPSKSHDVQTATGSKQEADGQQQSFNHDKQENIENQSSVTNGQQRPEQQRPPNRSAPWPNSAQDSNRSTASSYAGAAQGGQNANAWNTFGKKRQLKVELYLYVEASQPHRAFIQFSNGKTVPLALVEGPNYVSLWKYTLSFGHRNEMRNFRYKYIVSVEDYNPATPRVKPVYSLTEARIRCIDRTTQPETAQLDIFHSNTDQDYNSKTVPHAIFFYTKWVLFLVNHTNLREMLLLTEKMKYRSLDSQTVSSCLHWILEIAVHDSVTDLQRLYLCVVMGQLANNYQPPQLPLAGDERTRHAFDSLLRSLDVCAPVPLPRSSSNFLEKVAPILVEKSSYPGWLTLAAYFYPYLGIKSVLHARTTAGSYDKDIYFHLVKLLHTHVTRSPRREQPWLSEDLLNKVLRLVPDEDAIFALFRELAFYPLFTCEDKKVDFFVRFYADYYFYHKERDLASGVEKLVKLKKIPEKLRWKMPRLVANSFFEFLKSGNEPDQEEAEAFIQLITSTNLSKHQVFSILESIATSKSSTRHGMLLHLLNDQMFDRVWNQISLKERSSICSSWVCTMIARNGKKNEDVEVPTIVYHALNCVLSCLLNEEKKNLANSVGKSVSDWLFEKADACSILRGFADVQSFIPVVQDCYENLVKSLLKRDARLICRSDILSHSKDPRFLESLLSCVLEVVYVPDRSSKLDQENVLKRMLEWSDIWARIFSFKGEERNFEGRNSQAT